MKRKWTLMDLPAANSFPFHSAKKKARNARAFYFDRETSQPRLSNALKAPPWEPSSKYFMP